jgi:hypothetical protein
LHHLISPSQGVEKWIQEGWDIINDQERAEVEKRIDNLFVGGLPFQLTHDKIIYLYIFTLLSQFESIALQLPIRALPKLKNRRLKKLMRQQLIDEIFHAILFSRIARELSTPYNFTPEHNPCIDKLHAFFRAEKDAGTAIVLLKLIIESLFKEFLKALSEHDIAPNIFEIILEDERGHAQEAELYTDIGLPKEAHLRSQVSYLETKLIGDLFVQKKYAIAVLHALGQSSCIMLISQMSVKHTEQLAKLKMQPNAQDSNWAVCGVALLAYLDELEYTHRDDALVTPSVTRKILMSAWEPPVDPTMFSMFSLNVTRLGSFENKYPPQTLTGLVLQAMSKLSKESPNLRNYVSHNKMYNLANNYIHLVVSIPGETNHLALLKLKDAHESTLHELSERIKNYIEIMSYARYKSEALAQEYPTLLADYYRLAAPDANDFFQDIHVPYGVVTLTNVGPWGGDQGLSPLCKYEILKLTMSRVERKQIWNNKIKNFEIQDRLPIGLSADHRVFDANMGTPKMLQIALDEMIDKLEANTSIPQNEAMQHVDLNQYVELSNQMLEENMALGYYFLMTSSHCWHSDLDLNALHQTAFPIETAEA